MLSKICTAALNGLDAHVVTVETDISRGLPSLNTVGLPSATIREAKERIRSAIINSDLNFPNKRITVNLSPASSRKEGSHFDLPMAIGILVSGGELCQNAVGSMGFIGELSLDGRLLRVIGALPLVIGMRNEGIKNVIVPIDNLDEVSIVPGINIYPAGSLIEIADHLSGLSKIEIFKEGQWEKNEKIFHMDYGDVVGQENAKRAITIAIAGGHGLYLMGTPGAGKSMLAKRIPTIMPDLNYEEMLELTKIYSVAGILSKEMPLIDERPFRAPHHKTTPAALLGGGKYPKPGEISLAHKGILFLDEFPEFDRKNLELLRQPLETGKILIQRAEGGVEFPCDFILIAAGNPCKCGYYGDVTHECHCTGSEIKQYQSKLSGPLIDRIDIQIKVENVSIDDLEGKNTFDDRESSRRIDSSTMKRQVTDARRIQEKRYIGSSIKLNSQLEGRQLSEECKLDKQGQKLLREAYVRLGLSARSYEKIIKVSRTIADIEGTEDITMYHIGEALRYRALDGMYMRNRL